MDDKSDQVSQQHLVKPPGVAVFEVWKQYEEVAMHFNDLLMRLRSQSLAAIVAFAALAGVVLRGDIDSGFRWGVLSGVFLLLALFWVAIWVLDFAYYNRLLLGSVEALLAVEAQSKTGATVGDLFLSTQIEAAVAGRIPKRSGHWARAKARWLFYGIVFVALLSGLVVSVVAGRGAGMFRTATSSQGGAPVNSTPTARPALAGISLFDCEGKETGKVEGWVAKEQLLLTCSDKNCQAQFGVEKFATVRDEDGRYSGLTHYFEFDPALGVVQGITGSPYYYFTGKCVERKQSAG